MKVLAFILFLVLSLSESRCGNSHLGTAPAGEGSIVASTSGDCTDLYAGGKAPALLAERLGRDATTLCYQDYAVLVSGLTRTPLWSAERLTPAIVDSARATERVDVFHPDDHIPAGDRAELLDYRGSGYDRGHMSPSGDMPSPAAQQESFSLANIVPQAPQLNRGVWSDIEIDVRNLALRERAVYVVTGPIFASAEVDMLRGRVAAPSSIYKAIYVPGEGAAAWIATNENRPALRLVSVADLSAETGIDPFPAMDGVDRSHMLELSKPVHHRHG